MKNDIAKRKAIAIKAAKEAGRISLYNFKKPFKIKSKGDRNLVSEIDLRAERAIISLVKKHFPKDGILSEESPCTKSKSGFRWIIDPIDGTHNYIHKIAIFGTSIAVEFKGEVMLGIIYMPVKNELYAAEKNKGAYKNGKRIKVSKRKLNKCTLIYDSSIRYHKNEMLKGLGKLVDEVFNIRMFGSSARHLTYVAEGVAEADVEFHDKVWDFAAGLLIIEEAGGICTDFYGKKWSTNIERYIASNKAVHKDMLKAVGK